MRTEPDFYPASCRQMSQFVFKQIAYCPIQQSHISVHYDMLFEFSRYFMIVLGHCGLININQLSDNLGEVDRTAIDVKRTCLRFGKSLSRSSIASPTESRHFSFSSLHNADSSVPRIRVTGLLRSCAIPPVTVRS